MQKIFKLPELNLAVEIGKYAGQANGAAWISCGNNIVLSTAVATKEPKDFMGFFPLSVEYRERPFAAGKFPGGYIKREGRLSDNEILVSRMIDRPIRPLFPNYYFNEVQLLSSVYSADGKYPVDILALLGTSIALTISDIPFLGPLGAVKADKKNGEWKFNSEYQNDIKLDSSIVIAGTKDGICMVEGHCAELSEEEFINLLFDAHEEIKKQVDWQLEIQKNLNIKKAEVVTTINWDFWKDRVKQALPVDFEKGLFATTKEERSLEMQKLRTDLLNKLAPEIEEGEINESYINFLFDSLLKEVLPDRVIKEGKRIDGRKLNEIRPLSMDVKILPCTHGSAVFKRGETQALSSITLGTIQDAQKVEFLIGESTEKRFMLHYNMPPFSTGEVKPMRSVGRREIGHGYLAENSFNNVLPSKDEFPYTIRSVVDILESNGSSSMATVCSTTLSLMDAGVPIKNMISGIAMGLFKDSSGDYHILSDILGAEDAFGLMDFKITGTQKGIMSMQMDIKARAGLTKEILSKALEQAKDARLHILNEMKKVLSAPRKELSELAPRVHTFKIDPEKIGIIIGPSGRTIKEIIAQTDTEIDIEDDGNVMIYAKSAENFQSAIKTIKVLAGQIEVGDTFVGTIKKIADFGIFVEIAPGKDGLIHISKIDREIQKKLDEVCKINEEIKVKVQGYDEETGRISLIAPKLQRQTKTKN
ncbi:polyribonucleotide nucleotidyltransferase [Candidatus Dependentiae bacterium]|nr:polyribonucleotide nucleotidyltransferase [Candidatus Dependentiae bacterium]